MQDPESTTATCQPLVRNAVQCRICGASADRYHHGFQCQANPNHWSDLNVGIFIDMPHPDDLSQPNLSQPDLRQPDLQP